MVLFSVDVKKRCNVQTGKLNLNVFLNRMTYTEKQKSRLERLIEPLLTDLNFELVDTKLKKSNENKVLDIVIDREGGITVEDCVCASRKISLILDMEDLFPFPYRLEVGSPGIFRELRKESDYCRFLNSRVKTVYYTLEGSKRKLIGILTQYRNRRLTIRNGAQETTINLDRIKKIHLFPEI